MIPEDYPCVKYLDNPEYSSYSKQKEKFVQECKDAATPKYSLNTKDLDKYLSDTYNVGLSCEKDFMKENVKPPEKISHDDICTNYVKKDCIAFFGHCAFIFKK